MGAAASIPPKPDVDRDGRSSVNAFKHAWSSPEAVHSPLSLKPFFETLDKASSESLDEIGSPLRSVTN